VAESKRRGEKAVDRHLDDEVAVGAVDDDALADNGDLDFDDVDSGVDDGDSDDSMPVSGRKASTATKAAASAKQANALKAAKIAKGDVAPARGNRVARFVREVVAELRKVNWPSRKELLTYTLVVLVFVVTMMLIVGGLDYGFAYLVAHVFA